MTEGPAGVPHPFARPTTAPDEPVVSADELLARRTADAPVFLLDVRPSEERRLARLVDDRHIPLAELARRIEEVPRDRPVVTYDQFGGDARRALSVLRAAGVAQVAALDGGLDGYARTVDPTVGRYDLDHGGFVLRQLPRAATGCLSYFLGDVSERRAVIIDPGEDVEPYRHMLREGNWRLAAIVETHTHADHLAGHAALHHSTGAPILVGSRSPAQYPHRSLADGEAVEVGTRELVAIETPGHTMDHLTLQFGERIFTGDTLLIGACGRTDLGGGDPDLLYDSLTGRLLRLPDTTEVFPAHYGAHHALVDRYSSTIGVERATNEALLQPDRAAFRRYMTEGWPPKPANFDQIVGANLATFPD
jgi:glyoxylase-like metal-dependent hydrolase (beta-lactamase superfamily II)